MSEEKKNTSPKDHRAEFAKQMQTLREEHGYSLEELSKKTKVPLKSLHNLESGHEEFYREKLYSRGFISLLCKEFKVDSEVYLKQIDLCQEPNQQKTVNILEKEALSQIKPEKKTRSLSAGRFLLFLSLVIITFLLISFFFGPLGIPSSF